MGKGGTGPAFTHPDVEVIQGGGFHRDHDFTGRGDWRGHIQWYDLVQFPVHMDTGGLHGLLLVYYFRLRDMGGLGYDAAIQGGVIN